MLMTGAVLIITISLVVQIIAKQVIQLMWDYYKTLQLILLICTSSNIMNTASIITITKTIDDIINLSALDKKVILNQLSQPLIDFLLDYQMIALVTGPLLVVILILIVITKLANHPKLKAFINKVRQKLFWNFFIQYFLASYISFQFGSFVKILG